MKATSLISPPACSGTAWALPRSTVTSCRRSLRCLAVSAASSGRTSVATLASGKVVRLGDTLRHLFLLLDPEKQVGHVLQAIDQRECHRDVVAVIADHVVGRTEHVGEDEAPVAQVA